MAGKKASGSGGSGKEGVAAYLADPAFLEENAGPPVPDRWNKTRQRDPSPDQIRRRAAAIRRAYPRKPVGPGRVRWQPPVVLAPPGFDPELAVGKAV